MSAPAVSIWRTPPVLVPLALVLLIAIYGIVERLG